MVDPTALERKAAAWLGSNWYPFLIGCGCGAVVMLLARLVFKVL